MYLKGEIVIILLINTCVLALKMGKYNSLWIDTFKGGESTWKTSIK